MLQVPHVSFHAQDMLQSYLGDTAILMLTSFCWDRQLASQANDKIKAELLPGAVLVDYAPHLDLCLKEIAAVQIPVSWNSHQTIWVYEIQA